MKSWLTQPLFWISLLLIGFLLFLSMPSQNEKKQRQQAPVPVNLTKVSYQSFRDIIEGLGTAQANESVVLTSTVSDIVDKVHFKDGDKVNQGDILISLQSREERAKITELKAKLEEAKRQLNRFKNLQKEQATSEQLLDEQLGEVKTILAQLDVAKTKLDEMHIYAPFSGVLGIRQISPGALVKSGEAITTLDDISKIKLDFSVSEVYLPLLSAGQKIVAHSVAYKDQDFIGEILAVDSRVDPVTRSIQVRSLLDNAKGLLRAGMLMQLELEKSTENIILIPEGALVPINDRQYVYLVDEQNVATRVAVEIGRRRLGEVEIVAGLSEGQLVVSEGTLRLTPGAKVKRLEVN